MIYFFHAFFFEIILGAIDVITFLSLLQSDGYNPRTVKPYVYTLDTQAFPTALNEILEKVNQRKFLSLLLCVLGYVWTMQRRTNVG